MKATKESVLYVHKQGTDYECIDCSMFLFRLLRCTVHRSKDRILPFGSCGFWVFGSPGEFGKPEGSVTPAESGYVEHRTGFSCKRCHHFLAQQMLCLKVDENSDGDDLGIIHPDACCNAWESKEYRNSVESGVKRYRTAADRYTNALNAYTQYFKESHLQENRKLHYKTNFQGLPIVDENTGEEWETKMTYPYGYIRRTMGVDGDELDCFVGPKESADYAFVVHANRPDTTKFDEDKVMLGFDSPQEAKQAFLDNYDDPKFFGGMTAIPMKEFKQLAAATYNNTVKLVASLRFVRNCMKEIRSMSGATLKEVRQ